MTLAPTLTDTSHVNTGGAAGLLGCTRQRVLSLAARGLLQPVAFAGRVFFLRSECVALGERLDAESERVRTPRRRARR